VKRAKLMMQRIVAAGLLAVALVVPRSAPAADVTTVSGAVTYVSKEVVEVEGRRGLITNATSIVSDGHTVSLASVQPGMAAELEIDPAGNALEVRVKGAVE
jgi:hypothetical protein